jgi:hypothetical protein
MLSFILFTSFHKGDKSGLTYTGSYFYSSILTDESSRWAEAIEHAQVGILKFPHLPEFRFHLGNLFGKQVSSRLLLLVNKRSITFSHWLTGCGFLHVTVRSISLVFIYCT